MAEFVEIDDRQLRDLEKAFQKAEARLQDVAYSGLNMATSYYASKARFYAPVGATGHLKSSIGHGVLKDPNDPLRAYVGYVLVVPPGSRYVWYADRGRRPGRRPPFDPIYIWVKRKLHPGVRVTEGRFRSLVSADIRERLTRSITFAVMNKIARKGTKGSGFIRKTVSDTEAKENLKKIVKWII
ncbi:MAG: hypothetical protein DRP08_05405, partial [Candidatus Aenigmatarchaeota archaeon]